MPSDSETLGFVVLEAMASALPVVAVNAGGLPDIIDNGNNGYLVANDEDMIEFSDRVRQLIDDPSRRAELGAQARTWAEGWSWKRPLPISETSTIVEPSKFIASEQKRTPSTKKSRTCIDQTWHCS